jgi:lipid II:glycine glycyltransferase (peptidoglycan interpeptide bridge formation enzyme)
MLVWEAMKWAKAHGCLTYDMWGIPDEICEGNEESQAFEDHREDGLWGVYQFKRGFGRNIVTYIGAYDQVFYPRLYTLFHSRLFTGKGWERIATVLDSWNFGRS